MSPKKTPRIKVVHQRSSTTKSRPTDHESPSPLPSVNNSDESFYTEPPSKKEEATTSKSIHRPPSDDDELEVTGSKPATHNITKSGRTVQKCSDPNIYKSSAPATQSTATIEENSDDGENETILEQKKLQPSAPASKRRTTTDKGKGKTIASSPSKTKRKSDTSPTTRSVRSRTTKATPSTSQVTSELVNLKGWITFKDKPSIDRLAVFKEKGVSQCAGFDILFLDKMGIGSRVRKLVKNVGWETLFFLKHPTFSELALEFYTTFWLASDQFKPKASATPSLTNSDMVNFRLMGKWSTMSIDSLNCVLGAIKEDELDSSAYRSAHTIYPSDFDSSTAYQELTGKTNVTFNPRSAKGHELLDPALRLLHRLLALTFSGKFRSSGQMSTQELFILWCMHNGIKLNLGFWFACVISAIQSQPKSPVMGSLITTIAVNLHLLELPSDKLSAPLDLKILDRKTLDGMGFLCISQGVLRFTAGSAKTKDQASSVKNGGDFIYPSQGQVEHLDDDKAQDTSTRQDQDDRRKAPTGQDAHPSLLGAIEESNILLKAILKEVQHLTTEVARRNLAPL